jgi:hypothetical protein
MDEPKNGLQIILGDLGDRMTIVFQNAIGIDEATSALDPTSRILVFGALKHWHKNKINYRHHPRSFTDRTEGLRIWTGQSLNKVFGTIWKLNRNTGMKERRAWVNFERWWKHSVGLGVSSWKRAP